jgi:hypothetical protein
MLHSKLDEEETISDFPQSVMSSPQHWFKLSCGSAGLAA